MLGHRHPAGGVPARADGVRRATILLVGLLGAHLPSVALARQPAWQAPAEEQQVADLQTAGSQTQAAGQEDATQASPQALRVFLDCEFACDFDYLRREIRFVDYVRDRRDAQVHVLVTIEFAGGGLRYNLAFIGMRELQGIDQTLHYTSSSTNTDDERRAGLARIFAQGLIPYVAGTPLAERIEIRYQGDREQSVAATAPEEDPWNFWVFRVRGNFEFDGESRQDELSVGGSATANRTTDAWKIQIGLDGNYDKQTFEIDEGEILESVRRTYGFGAQAVKSLGDRWGVGTGFAAAASSFRNLDLSYRVAAAIERNLYPYSESSQRELTLTYFVGVTRFNYEEETIFQKTEETLGDHGLLLSLDLNRPWGRAGFDVEASHYLHDLGKRRLEVRGNLEYRIVRGLSVDIQGAASSVRDQLFLPRRDATEEEILLRQRALATDFEYRIELGLSYTFGSIFNNVVNSRFTGSSGGFHRVPGVQQRRGGGRGG